MPRQPRLDAPGTLHHVMGRGIERTRIFRNKIDRNDFLDRLAELSLAEHLKVYAWVLMSNHFHLLVRTGNQPLASNMRKLLTGYVVNFNRRHDRCGHLFQNRYKSIVCEDDPYLLELTRYIHLNPLRAGVLESLDKLNRYLWSGHAVLMGKVQRKWQDTETVLAYFGKKNKAAIKGYERFIEDGVSRGRRPELVGGGLVRSSGGWSEVVSLRRKGKRLISDERILGSSEFVERIIAQAQQKEQETLRLLSKISDLESLARKISAREGIDEQELRSGSKKRVLVRARRLFCQLAVRKMGYSGAEVARFLGVTTSAVNRSAASHELPGLDRYI